MTSPPPVTPSASNVASTGDDAMVAGASNRFDAFQRRHRALGFPIAVIYKFIDDSGTYLAALFTYYAFISLFPLLLLASTILGFVLAGDPALRQNLLDSALRQFPVVGTQLTASKSIGGGAIGVVIGVLGSLYGGPGVAQALQYAMNTAWGVPRHRRPNPFKGRGRSILILVILALTVVVTTGLSSIGSGQVGVGGSALRTGVLIGSVVVNAAAFAVVFRVATARDVSWRDIAPGALTATIAWQLLQTFGVAYVNHVVRHSSDTNGVFALVLGLLAFLYLTGLAVVFSVEINVVRVERLFPRSLLTPFTDNVTLTGGDRRAYTSEAATEERKGFERIDVDLTPPPG